jgi:hypothetical protein
MAISVTTLKKIVLLKQAERVTQLVVKTIIHLCHREALFVTTSLWDTTAVILSAISGAETFSMFGGMTIRSAVNGGLGT